ncbi:hypothetical protein DXC21_01365 [Coprobacillus sp. OM08-19]|jgi:hypothetical protein|uniref:Uncharacterized protein n=1 Tax=Faecalibacillus intestinalis TaxID=1982626 RepID=A0AAW4VMP3_9FIRM|nr:hypothetical protein [Faecalibacillus intestinalis]MCB8563056.1 hypothetical protein [Faecalibacillus intestinalis]MCG4809924.1 hypothetical protein [Faecalibacillus intestinalis]RGI26746.1 hypothetical protein DXC21_01365 [Coprobacillus sp. OM08-19]
MNNEINNEVVDFGFNLSDIINSLDDDSNIEKSNEIEKLNESKIDTLKCVLDNYQQTDRKLLETLTDTVDLLKNRETQKSRFKLWFFIIIMTVFVILCLSPFVILFLFRNIITNQSLIVTIIGTLTEILTAIIVLPKIIANYLFNLNEDKEYFNLISDLKSYHEKKSRYIDSNK